MFEPIWYFISNDLWQMVFFACRAMWNLLPAFLFSVFLGVTLTKLHLDRLVGRAFSKRPSITILLGTAVGALEPFCACSIVPIVAGLLMSGVPLSGIMAFWVASPTIDPEIFAMTVTILGWELATGRLVAVIVLSLAMGYVSALVVRIGFIRGDVVRSSARVVQATSCCELAERVATAPAPALDTGLAGSGAVSLSVISPAVGVAAGSVSSLDLPPDHGATFNLSVLQPGADASIPLEQTSACCASEDEGASSCCGPTADAVQVMVAASQGVAAQEPWWRPLWRDARALHWPHVLREVGIQTLLLSRWLVVAFMVEKALMMYVPAQTIVSLVGPNNPLAVPLGALLGVLLFFNNEQALPIVAGLYQQGMQPGAAIAFMLAGPVTTVPAMIAIWSVVKPRVFFLHAGVGLIGAIMLGYLSTLFLG
jgi:uncharacterized membrane protein YraQ (UPF0718 family)